MSAQTPQVLSRMTNASAAESTKGKAAADRPGKAKGSVEKHGEARSTAHADTPKATKTRAPQEGEKVIIRRLPPGLTEAECLSILGSEWVVGNGKVDWFSYATGKVSNELSKPSRPARAYIHLMRKEYIMPLSDVVRNATWEDAKSTFTSPSLIGPPILEIAIYKKVPGAKKRVDARQGTIDQDPEFMAFLEELANPTPPKEGIENDDVEEAAESKAKVTTTPLIEFLKEKKANKAKEAAAAKSAKHGRSQDASASKGKSTSKEDEGSRKKGKEAKNSKSEKAAPKEPVKILTKKVTATEQPAEASKPAANQASSASASGTAAGAADAATPKSRRAGVSIAARILQRDLGLSPGSAYRRARQDAAKAEAGSKPAVAGKDSKEQPSPTNESVTPSASTSAEPTTTAQAPGKDNAPKAQQSARKTRGGKNADKPKASEPSSTATPVILKKKGGDADTAKPAAEATSAAQQNNSSKPATGTASGPKGASSKSSGAQKKSGAATSSASVTRGFVKHANSSQGITEAVLKQALEAFGTVTFIEVDKRKGFAYVDFADHSGLSKAISASPISVAQGTVQVLERKDKKPAAAASSSSGNAAATPSASNTTNNGAASEKSSTTNSGRGRRGRGGKGTASTNGTAIAATSGG